MALALSIPLDLPGREQIVTLVFGAVLFSLVIQGLSLPWLVKQLKVSNFSESARQVEQWQAQLIAAKAAQDELVSLLKLGVLSKSLYEEMRANYQVKVAAAEKSLREFYNRRQDNYGGMGSKLTQLDAIRRRLLLAEKGALNEAMRQRILSETIARSRLEAIDEQLLNLEDD